MAASDPGDFSFGAGFGFILGAALCCFILSGMYSASRHHFKKEAISRGHASWVVNEDGETKFEWKEPAE